MKKEYQKPSIKVREVGLENIMAASVTGSKVNDDNAPTNATGLSKSNNIWDSDDAYSPWGDGE